MGFGLDAVLAAAIYFGVYWTRFPGGQLAAFLPGFWFTLPWVMTGQLLALVVAGAYRADARATRVLRVVVAVIVGTATSVVALAAITGFEGLSRAAFVADALLMALAALAWRGIWVLRHKAALDAPAPPLPDDLVDRATEMTTLGGVAGSLFGYRELLKNLVFKDLKLKYRGSVFGFLWSLANPLLMIAVYTVAFTYIMRMRGEGFVFYLMLGMLSWTFFASSAGMATGAIADNSGLLKSVLFPRAILPIATVLFNLAQYLLTIAVFLPVMIVWYGKPLGAPMLAFPFFLALQVLFTIGIAFMLATWTVFFRDVRHLLEVALAMLFWTTPIVYEWQQVPEHFRLLVLLSPVSPFIVAYQEMFFYGQWPEPTVWLIATVHAVGAFVIGALVFLAFEDRLTEQL